MRNIINYFKNGSRVKVLEKELRIAYIAKRNLENIRIGYEKGDKVFFIKKDDKNDLCIRAEIIGIYTNMEGEVIYICEEINSRNIYLKHKNEIINFKK